MAADETINIEVKSNLGELNKDIGNTSKLIRGVEGSVDGAQKAMDAFGVSSDTTNKSLEGVQTAMNFTDGIKQITNLGKVIKTNTTVTRLWNLAMKANPIGFLVTAVTALIAGITALIFWMKKSSEQSRLNTKLTKESTKALKKQTKAIDDNAKAFDRKQKQELAMAIASGKSVEAIRELEIKLVDEKLAYIASERAIAKQTLAKERNTLATLKARGAEEDLIDEQLKNVVQAVDNFNTLNKAIGDTLIERGDLLNRHIVERKQAETDARREAEKERKEAIAKELADIEKANQDKIDAEKDLQKKLKEEREKAFEELQIGQADAWERRANKALDEEEELAELKIAIQERMFNNIQDLISSSLNAQGNRIEAEYKKEVRLAEANGKSTEAIEEKYNAKRTALAEKQKKVKIALAMIDMYQSAVAAYNQGMGVPPPAGLTIAPVAAGLAIAAGLANINSIMQTDVGVGGGGGATATAPTGGSPAPQMMSGAFELSGGTEPEAFRAYVVTDEMTNSQNQLANIRRRATI